MVRNFKFYIGKKRGNYNFLENIGNKRWVESHVGMKLKENKKTKKTGGSERNFVLAEKKFEHVKIGVFYVQCNEKIVSQLLEGMSLKELGHLKHFTAGGVSGSILMVMSAGDEGRRGRMNFYNNYREDASSDVDSSESNFEKYWGNVNAEWL